jgi:hypothetical protein
MSNQEEGLRVIAGMLDEILLQVYGQKMGFFLVTTPFDTDDAIADYIGNAERKESVEWMKETIDRLEKQELIPATVGGKQ